MRNSSDFIHAGAHALARLVTLLILFAAAISCAHGQEFVEQQFNLPEDTIIFALQIPQNYDPSSPPAIIVAWHAWGADQYEVFTYTEFPAAANEHGWLLAGFLGSSYYHWNAAREQFHCRYMLDWISEHYPFHADSIYMIGGSMGGAAGHIWHNNNCGSRDYLIAATAGGSQIIDTQLRAEQYLAAGDTNRSMRDVFGGLPGERDSIDYNYHRASAIHFADTLESMHFNALTLPVYSTWGNTDIEWEAYGLPALMYQEIRGDHPELNTFFLEDQPAHGWGVMWPVGICDWLAQWSVNRYPDTISINADEAGEYYYTVVTPDIEPYTMARYGVFKDSAEARIDINLVRNVAQIDLLFDFPWNYLDTLRLSCNFPDTPIETIILRLRDSEPIDTIIVAGGGAASYVPLLNGAEISHWGIQEYLVVFNPDTTSNALPRSPTLPARIELVRAYPNPFNAVVTIQIRSARFARETLLLSDILGRTVQSYPLALTPGETSFAISAEQLATGVYFVRLQSAPGKPVRLTLLK